MTWRESEVAVYLVHAVSLLWPGVRVPDFEVHKQAPEPMAIITAHEVVGRTAGCTNNNVAQTPWSNR